MQNSRQIKNVHFNVSKDNIPKQSINITNWSFSDAEILLDLDADTVCEDDYSNISMSGDESGIVVFNQKRLMETVNETWNKLKESILHEVTMESI